MQAFASTATNTAPSLAYASVDKPVMKDAAVGVNNFSTPNRRMSSTPLPASSTFVLPRQPPRPRWKKVLSRLARGTIAMLTAVAFQRVCDTSSSPRRLNREYMDMAPLGRHDDSTLSEGAAEENPAGSDASPELEMKTIPNHEVHQASHSDVMSAARAHASRIILVGGAMACSTI